MLSFLKFVKKSPLMPAWHFTKNTTFVGAKDLNVVCYLNKGHILLSRKGSCYVATPELIKNEPWNKLLSAFDDKGSAMETRLVVVAELNETCEKVLGELTLEAETAGLHSIMD
jgi:hypothetical protein